MSGFVSHQEVLWDHPRTVHFAKRLESFARVVRYDKRGQGLSDRPARPPTLEESMDDLRAVMDAAGFERAALFGVSEGGPMCQLFAATHPDRATALALYGTYARATRADDYPIGFPPSIMDTFNGAMLDGVGRPGGRRGLRAPPTPATPEFRDWWARLLRSGTSPHGATALLDLYKELDTRAVLANIGVPTLVLHRRDDMLVHEPQAAYLAEHIPGARYEPLDGRDHLVFAGDQDAVLDRVEEFFTGTRPGPGGGPRPGHGHVHRHRLLHPARCASWATGAGASSWNATTSWCAASSTATAAGRSSRWATASWPRSTARPGPSAARARYAMRCGGWVSRSARDCTPASVEVIGDDVGGMAVHIGARVGARAEAGEVLVSSTVRDLVVGSGIEFAERGEHDAQGRAGRVAAVCRQRLSGAAWRRPPAGHASAFARLERGAPRQE